MTNKIKIAIVCIGTLLMLACCIVSLDAQDRPVITFNEEGKVHLRWPARHDARLTGYHVYRRPAGQQAWSRLTSQPVTMIRSEARIRQMAGYKADLFLQLFGGANAPGDITDQRYAAVISDPQSLAFLDVMTMINPEFGPLMGVVYVDSAGVPAGVVEYKITTLKNGLETDYAFSRPSDTRNPQVIPVVTGLEGEAGNQSAYLTWDKDQETLKSGDIVSYAVFRSDNLLGPYEPVNYFGMLPVTVSSGGKSTRENTEEYRDEYLDNGKTYYYHIKAVNAFGITGPASATVEITPLDRRMPEPPRDLQAVRFGTGLKLSWTPVPSIIGYEIYKSQTRDGSYRKIYPATDVFTRPDTFYIDLDVKPATSYYYFLISVNKAGIMSHPSDTLPVFLEDTDPPEAPGPVETVVERDRISLYWPRSGEEDVIGYEVERSSDDLYRSRLLLTNEILADTVYIDTLPEKSETTYGYFVYAIDRSYNRSRPSEMVQARLPDRMPPSAPVMTGLDRTGDKVKLSWTRSTEPDLSAYRIYGSNTSATSLKTLDFSLDNSYTDTLESSGTYFYAVSALDSAGNESRKSGVLSVNYDENEIPQPSSGGTVKKSGNFLKVEWEPVTQSGTAGYVVTRIDLESGKKLDVAEVRVPFNSYTDRFADPGKEYEYRIRTFDTKWRMSEPLELIYQPEK